MDALDVQYSYLLNPPPNRPHLTPVKTWNDHKNDLIWPGCFKVESILESAEKDFPDNENVQNRAKNLDSKYKKIIEMAEVSLILALDFHWLKIF